MFNLLARYSPSVLGFITLFMLAAACSSSRPTGGRSQPPRPSVITDKTQPDADIASKDTLNAGPGGLPTDSAVVAENPNLKDSATLGLQPEYNVVLVLPFLKTALVTAAKT